jgi:protein-disulfide isomerase
MTSKWTIPIAIIAAGIILAAAVYLSIPHSTANGHPALVRPVGSSDHIFGNPGAKVMIVEYSDFNCELCAGMHDILHQVVANEGTDGSVAWVLRAFPQDQDALQHAEAAECAAQAGGNDAFWRFADALFAHQPVDPSAYGTYAATVGILGNSFASCFADASATVGARIEADRQNAVDIGAEGAPYSLILVNGQDPIVLNGAWPYDVVKGLVDEALAN